MLPHGSLQTSHSCLQGQEQVVFPAARNDCGSSTQGPPACFRTALLTGLPSPAGSSVPSGAGGNITIYKSKLLLAREHFPARFHSPAMWGGLLRGSLWSQTFTTSWSYKHDCMSQTLQQHPVPVRQNPAMFCTWEIYFVWISWVWWFVSSLNLSKGHFARSRACTSLQWLFLSMQPDLLDEWRSHTCLKSSEDYLFFLS